MPPSLRPLFLLLFLATTAHGVDAAAEALLYKRVAGRDLRLLVEKPAEWKASDRRPAVVFFFGGGWVGGNTAQFLPQSRHLATRGLVGIRAEYRTIPPGDAGPPTVCCADAKSAMRHVRAHAAELGVDPQRLAAAGGSAGGHLAAFTALVAGQDDPQDDPAVSCRPNALVLFNPVCNNGPGQWGHERVRDRFKEFSPAHNISPAAPPTVIFVGDQDKLIPVQTMRDFTGEMKTAGVRCDLHIYPGAGHGFFNTDTPGHPWFTETLAETGRFLASLGWLENAPALPGPKP